MEDYKSMFSKVKEFDDMSKHLSFNEYVAIIKTKDKNYFYIYDPFQMTKLNIDTILKDEIEEKELIIEV